MPTGNTTILALHCSGSTGRQWQPLQTVMGGRFNILAPDLLESGAALRWSGDGPFRLTDEARTIIDTIDATDRPIHLVGHSYGGCVALRIAIERPHRVMSLSLYEPTVFHLLNAMGEDGCRVFDEIRAWGLEIGRHVMSGAYRPAAKLFYEYWNGPGSFPLAKQEVQIHLARYMFKVCLEFCAVLGEETPLSTYRGLRIPVLIICGEATSKPVASIARKLAEVMKARDFRVVTGAGHMGPISHPEIVMKTIAAHVLECDMRSKTLHCYLDWVSKGWEVGADGGIWGDVRSVAMSALSRCPLLAGPEYAALMDGIQDIDPESEDGQEIASTIQRLDKLCAP